MSLFTGEKSTRNGNNTLNNKNMIKRIYYYFKLKELLEMSELMPFVNYLMSYKGKSLFKMCMQTKKIRWWFDNMVSFKCTYSDLLPKARIHAEYYGVNAERITRRFFCARDIWMKQKHF